MSSEVFVNVYIENLLGEVSELTKTKILLQTQLAYAEKQAQTTAEVIRQHEQTIEELNNQIESLKVKKARKEQVTE